MRPVHFLAALAMFFMIGLTSCSENACENTLCENGGACIDGRCDCPEGFTGVHCSERAIPDQMRITSVTVTRFPELKDGTTWDDVDGPDIYFVLYHDSIPLAKPIALIENADAARDYSFSLFNIEMNMISEQFTMKLLDYDGFNIQPEYMGEINFIPFDIMNGFPETIVLDDGGLVAFVIKVEYLYEKKDPVMP